MHDISNPDSKHILMYLKELCPLITNKHLAESSSYNLLLSVIGGETFIVVADSMEPGEPSLKNMGPPLKFLPTKRTPTEFCV